MGGWVTIGHGFNVSDARVQERHLMRRLARTVLFAVPVIALAVLASAEGTSAGSGPGPTTISSGETHTCGVQSNGTLACWGDNASGKATPPSGTFSQVSAGGSHTCAIKTDHTLACWGDTSSGQATAPGGTFSQVSAGGLHTCAIKTDGTLACWGDNSLGQSSPPAGAFSQVSAGGFHTCGVRIDGTVACWGYNFSGQASPPAGNFSQVSAGGSHTCGVQSNATLACWGDNFFGQATPPAGHFTQVSAGDSHTCAIQNDGTVACWGYNFSGQATPPTTGTFSQVSAGGSHTCAIKTDGTVACWGDNTWGQATPPAGNFAPVSDTTPPAITVPANITAEATGPSGAVVTYAVSATDPDDAATVSCTPASGSTFPVGVTTVACTATDTHGNTSNASFTVTVTDTTPPVVTITVSSPVEASGPSGATVVYTADASDTVSGSLPASCTPLSGSTFALGSTTITCSATDNAGNKGTATATVVVRDTSAPTLSLPANITTAATSASGAVVTYSVTATDPNNPQSDLTVSCNPASGSTFAPGSTTVTCKATDPAGNTSTGSFTVTVVDFSLGPISPITVQVGGTASASVTVNSENGFSSPVALSASASRGGVSLTLSPSSLTPPAGGSASSTLSVALSPMVTPTTFTVTVTGTAGSVSHSTTVSVTVIASSSGISAVLGQMLASGCLNSTGVENALTAKISAEQAASTAGNTKTAINILTAFIDQVRAQSGKHILSSCTIGGLTLDPAAVLINDARSLINSLAVSATPNPITGSVLRSAGVGISGATVTLQDSTGTILATHH